MTALRRTTWLGALGLGALVVLVALGTLASRVVVEGRAALRRGDRAMTDGRVGDAIAAYRSAGRWWLPGAPWSHAARERLAAIARRAEEEGNWLRALDAWDGLRAATLGARSLWVPDAGLLAEANRRLPDVMVRARRVHPNAPHPDPLPADELRAQFERDVARDAFPPAWPSTLASVAFVVWIGASLMSAWRLGEGTDKLAWRRARPWMTLAAVCLAAWVGLLASMIPSG